MKGLRFLFVLALMASLLPAVALLAYEVPKDIVIKRPERNKPLVKWVEEVKFPHGFHAVYNACRDCHHKESAKTLGEYVPCRQCHNNDDPEDPAGFYLAWHSDNRDNNSCLGCHRHLRLASDALPPLSCTDGCHKLKK
ncbi:cytochrome c3 family protein [Desulfocurvus sp. DL9XJH121]